MSPRSVCAWTSILNQGPFSLVINKQEATTYFQVSDASLLAAEYYYMARSFFVLFRLGDSMF